jgi:ABC-type dipeptide/oligopeptide/nickel transport system permease component
LNDILEYAVRRIIAGFFVVLAVSVLIFGLMQLMPGDPISLVSNPRISEQRIQELTQRWGLDKPPHLQYFYWISRIVQGDMGTSIVSGQSVLFMIRSRLPNTLILTGTALILQYLLAVPLGLIAAVRRGSRMDNMLVTGTIVLWSMPPFWLGILLMIVFAIQLNWLPLSGYASIYSLVLPVATITLPSLASVLRLTRSEVLEVLREKYVVTASAKGLPRYQVLVGHVLRNALIPVTVMFFLYLPWLIGGSVIIESIFAWPGMGGLLWRSISMQDFPVVQGIVLIIAVLTVVSNTIGDILAGFLDPRVRLELRGDSL